jgi:phytanoyl-CoA hydroxylase
MKNLSLITEANLNFFNENGYFVKSSLWTPDNITEIKQAAKNFDSFKNKNYMSVMNPHKQSPVFMKALAHAPILNSLKQFFGGEVSAIQSQMFYGPPNCKGYSNHQDNFYLQTDSRNFISVWTSLDDASAINGGLIMYPKSHIEPILPTREIAEERRGHGQDPNSHRVEVVFSENSNYSPINLTTKSGDSVFIHGNVVHGSNDNNTVDRFRNSLLCIYIKSGTTFRSGDYAKREELKL